MGKNEDRLWGNRINLLTAVFGWTWGVLGLIEGRLADAIFIFAITSVNVAFILMKPRWIIRVPEDKESGR